MKFLKMNNRTLQFIYLQRMFFLHQQVKYHAKDYSV